MTEKNITPLLKAVSIVHYVFAALNLLVAIGVFVGGTYLLSMFGENLFPGNTNLAMLGGVIFGVLGFFVLGYAVLDFFIARGIGRARPWARIVAIIFAGLAIFGGLVGLAFGGVYGIANLFNGIANLFTIAIYGGIGYVLVIHKESVACFK